MPGNNDIHPRRVAEQVHRLIPNAQWAEVRPHAEEPEKYVPLTQEGAPALAITGTERRRPRPIDAQVRKEHDSGTKKTPTEKNLLLIDETTGKVG